MTEIMERMLEVPENISFLKGDEVENNEFGINKKEVEGYDENVEENEKASFKSRRKSRKAKIKAKKRMVAIHLLRNPSYTNPYRTRKWWDNPKCSDDVLSRNLDRRNANSKRFRYDRK